MFKLKETEISPCFLCSYLPFGGLFPLSGPEGFPVRLGQLGFCPMFTSLVKLRLIFIFTLLGNRHYLDYDHQTNHPYLHHYLGCLHQTRDLTRHSTYRLYLTSFFPFGINRNFTNSRLISRMYLW